ncbi:MAG: hypothetical protein NC935_08405 [Candidatus Omnitrophica bacterium]|nr:hypothetical protein [Candidatus Omnitrophota bacterium]
MGLVEQGWNISCLSSSPTDAYNTNHVPENNTVQIKLKGNCQGRDGCYLVVCQGENEQWEEDNQRLEECKNHSPFERLPDYNSWEGGRTWGEWCSHIEEQMGNTFQSSQGCRSGVSEVDAVLPNSSDPNIPRFVLTNRFNNYHFAPGPIETTITLNNAYDHIPYQFYAFGRGGQNNLATGQIEGESRSQQQGQLTFNFGEEGNVSKCVTITWDPYGRVFDSQSLEPIANIKVNLLDKDKKPVSQITKNYDITGSNGVFNIQVEKEGFYYMSVNTPSTHEFVLNPKLNPNYKYIYSDLYYPNNSFFEKAGIPTHHDIPLNPLGPPYRSSIVIYEKSLNQMDMGNNVKFEGKVSHPLARICLIGEISKKEYACTQADKIGQFQIFINKSSYPQEALIIKTAKVNPNNINQFVSQSVNLESLLTPIQILANKTTARFEPLIRYIEGYVYNSKGLPATNADVFIRLKADNKIVGRLKTDKNGFIKINSSQLPLFDYYLELRSDNNEIIKINTSKFISQNKDYLEKNNINPMINRQDDSKNINENNQNIYKNITENNKNTLDSKNLNNNKTFNFEIKAFLLLFVIIILIIIAFLIFIYIKKKSLLTN